MLSAIFQIQILCFAIFSNISLSKSETNILLNKTILIATDDANYATNINDGNVKTCLGFDSENKKMIAFDLGKSYKISRIIVRNGNYRATIPANFYIGNVFQACQFQVLINNYGKCDPLVQNNSTNELICKDPSNVGRYLVLTKGNPFDYDPIERLYLCDIEVYGVESTIVNVPTRPVVDSSSLVPITKDYFKIVPIIRNNVPIAPIPVYGSAVIYINKNCEPIIYDRTKSLSFGVACQNGKGRMVAFAKSGYFRGMGSDPTQNLFRTNILSWLTFGNQNPPTIVSSQVTKMSDFYTLIRPGTVVYFDVWKPCPSDILNTWKTLLLNGTVSMVVEITFWISNTVEARNSYLQILNIFNVDFLNSFIGWNSVIYSDMPDTMFNDTLIDLEEICYRMLLNHDYLISKAPLINSLISNYPSSMLANSKVPVYLSAIIKKYESLLRWICPCDVQQASNLNDRQLIRFLGEIMKNQALSNSNFKAPCVELFPGDYIASPPKVTVKLDLVGVTAFTDNPIGYYLEAGTTLQYKVTASSGSWSISVGCHIDNLPDSLTGWARYPSITVYRVPLSDKGFIYSAFGGVLWLNNDVVGAKIAIELSNVVVAPFFNLRDSDAAAKWNDRRSSPGIWSQIAGDSIVFCEKSWKLKSFDGQYMVDLMKNIWDKVVRTEMVLTDTDWKTQRPQITVLDIMLSFGYGHSGYPVELYQDWYSSVFNSSNIKQIGSWGMCHEVGHNLQRSKWTFYGTIEVTNNLQCLFVYDKLLKLPRYGTDLKSLGSYVGTISAYLQSGAVFSEWTSNPKLALLIYSQMSQHLGWGLFIDVFDYYETNNISPRTDSQKMITFMNISSVISQQNLIPIFDFWGFPIDNNLSQQLTTLPCFFPANDFLVSLSLTRKNYIASKYQNCKSLSLFYKDCNLDPLIVGMRPNFIQETI